MSCMSIIGHLRTCPGGTFVGTFVHSTRRTGEMAGFLNIFGTFSDLLRYMVKHYLSGTPHCVFALMCSCRNLHKAKGIPVSIVDWSHQVVNTRDSMHKLHDFSVLATGRYELTGLVLRFDCTWACDQHLREVAKCPHPYGLDMSCRVDPLDHRLNRHRVQTCLAAIHGCPSLHTLSLNYLRRLHDLSPLETCSSLHTLQLRHCDMVADISCLRKCSSLQEVYLDHCFEVEDVSDLGQCRALRRLFLCNTSVSNVANLANCSNLHTLDLRGTMVEVVSGLVGLPNLQILDLGNTRVTEVSTLAGCTALQVLSLHGTWVNDVSHLAKCPCLRELDLSGSKVTRVAELTNCRSLRTLDVSNAPVQDLSACQHWNAKIYTAA